MAKHLTLQIHRVITATLQSCRRSKDPSVLPENPVSTAASDSPHPPKVLNVAADPPSSPRRKICSSSPPFVLLPAVEIENRKGIHKKRNRRVSKSTSTEAPADLEIPAVFKKLLIPGKVKPGSFAMIVKKSEDPYEDFKDSMMEMILDQKQIIGRNDLEELLECFLSLNSRRYHGVIIHAFSEIWEALFFPLQAAGQPVGVEC